MFLEQPGRGYRYSLDPFLLAAFCAPRRAERLLDLGTGAGVLGLLLCDRHPTVRVTGIELDPELARCAARNARANGLDGRFAVVRGDLRLAPRFLRPEQFHRVVANPPYRRVASGATSPDRGRARARHELTFTVGDCAATASAMLRYGGSLELVHLAERLADIFRALAAAGLEPKKLRFVAPFAGSAPRLCMLSATKGARPGLTVMPPLIVHDRAGSYADEVASLMTAGRPAAASKSKKRTPAN